MAVLIALGASLAAACGGGDKAPSQAAETAVAVASPTPLPTADAPATSCAPGWSAAPGESRIAMAQGGLERSYLLHVPAVYNGSSATPLVIAMHGYGGSAESMRDLTGLAAAADDRGMIVAFPQGTGTEPAWNVAQYPVGPDDTAFLLALIDDVAGRLCIDMGHVHAAGFSNGGGMALRFACDAPDRLRAIAVVGATFIDCAAAVPLIAFHGDQDAAAPYVGGEIAPGVILPPVEEAVARWARALGCQVSPAVVSPSNEIVLTAYGSCPSGEPDAQLYTINGGGHTWPGSAIEVPGGGTTTKTISASELMLDFFYARLQIGQ